LRSAVSCGPVLSIRGFCCPGRIGRMPPTRPHQKNAAQLARPLCRICQCTVRIQYSFATLWKNIAFGKRSRIINLRRYGILLSGNSAGPPYHTWGPVSPLDSRRREARAPRRSSGSASKCARHLRSHHLSQDTKVRFAMQPVSSSKFGERHTRRVPPPPPPKKTRNPTRLPEPPNRNCPDTLTVFCNRFRGLK